MSTCGGGTTGPRSRGRYVERRTTGSRLDLGVLKASQEFVGRQVGNPALAVRARLQVLVTDSAETSSSLPRP